MQSVTSEDDSKLARYFLKAVNSYEIGTNYDPGKKFRISNMGYECLRKLQLDRDAEHYLPKNLIDKAKIREKNIDQSKIGPATLGTLIHGFIEEALKNGKYRENDDSFYINSEEEISFQVDDLEFIGHYDLLLQHPTTKEKIVVDVKTVNSAYSFNFVPSKKHLDQLILYQYHLGKIPGYLFYISRDRGEVNIYRSEFSMVKFEKALRRLKLVKEVEDLTILLPTLSSPEDFPCRGFCPYVDFCWENLAIPPFNEVQNPNE